MAKKNVSEIEKGVGYLMGLVTTMMNIVRERDIPFEALYRLVTPAGRATIASMVDVAHADWQDEQPQTADLIVPAGSEIKRPLADGEYRVHVGYDMPRDRKKLEAEFSKDGVSELFYDNYNWRPDPSCTGIDQRPGERIMLVKHFGRKTTSEANIAEMDELGYRPATHLEAYAFAKANPELQLQFWIVALGSSTMDGVRRCVALLRGGSGGRILVDGWFDNEWGSDGRFLFVRK